MNYDDILLNKPNYNFEATLKKENATAFLGKIMVISTENRIDKSGLNSTCVCLRSFRYFIYRWD